VCTNCYKGWQLSRDRKDLRQQAGQLPANKLEATKSPLKHRHIAGSWPGLISSCLWPQVLCWGSPTQQENTQHARHSGIASPAKSPNTCQQLQGLSPRAPIPTSSTILAQSKTAIHNCISQKGSYHFLLVHASHCNAHSSWYCCQSPEHTYHHKLLPGAKVCLQSIRSSWDSFKTVCCQLPLQAGAGSTRAHCLSKQSIMCSGFKGTGTHRMLQKHPFAPSYTTTGAPSTPGELGKPSITRPQASFLL
jgi:hypothetical protein